MFAFGNLILLLLLTQELHSKDKVIKNTKHCSKIYIW